MPASKRTRTVATDENEASHDENQPESSTSNRTTPRRSPARQVTTPSRSADPSTPSAPSRPTRVTPRTRLALSSSPCPNALSPTQLSRSSSLFAPGQAGPSTRGATLVRAASTSAVPTMSRLKETVSGNGSGPPSVKGSNEDFGGGPSRFGKGKENVPPPKEPHPLPTPPSESSRKRVRVARDGRSVRSASSVSMRSESTGPSSFSDLTRRTSSCLPSPSPSPSVATTATDDSMDIDVTPTKSKFPATYLMTPPPSSPAAADLEVAIGEMAVRSRTASQEPEREYTNPYRALKGALRLSATTGASATTAVVGRDDEKAILSTYLGLVSTCDVGMYISGPPGTGKTALTTAAGRDLAAGGWRVVEIGVMGLKATEIWTRLASELGCGKSEEEVIYRLCNDSKPTFIILDEIDSLLPPAPALPPPATSHVLSKLFSLPLLSSGDTKVKLVAISNTLDLTVRANLILAGGAMPQVLPFKAYNSNDMLNIVNARVDATNEGTAKVDSRGIELLCRKVEAQSGDLRMCLSVLTTAVGLAEADWTKKKTANPDTPLIKVALPHIIKAFSSHTQQLRAAAGSSSSGSASPTATKIRSVPLQGRMVLISLLVFIMRSRLGLTGCPAIGSVNEALSPKALYTTYSHLLSHESSPVPPSQESDYLDLLSNLETLGLISLVRARGGTKVVELCVREDEVKQGLGIGGDKEGRAEEEVARVWAREEARIERVKAKASAAFARAQDGLIDG